MASPRTVFSFRALLLWLAGIAAAALLVFYTLMNLSTPPKLLMHPKSADACADALMQSVCQGEFDGLSQYLYGSPDLGLAQAPEDGAGKLLWEAWVGSLSYEFDGPCYAAENGLARDLRFTCLDIGAVTERMGPIAEEVFHHRLDTTEDQDLIYDDQNSYRDDFIQSVIEEATRQALAENTDIKETVVPLQLAYYQGRWLVVADSNFLNTVFGEITG